MKYRKDFVTNSSSSSYVCEICGREECGMNLSLSDCDMMECVNGHVFCKDEALKIPDKKELITMILENEWNKDAWDSEIKNSRDYSEDELNSMDADDLFKNFCSEGGYYAVPECVCPICQFHEYSEEDMAAFLLKEYKVPKEEIFAEVKKLNRRRRKLYNSEYITAVCQRNNINPIKISATWKDRFGSYAAFHRYIRED